VFDFFFKKNVKSYIITGNRPTFGGYNYFRRFLEKPPKVI
jgi:hypothetical protein